MITTLVESLDNWDREDLLDFAKEHFEKYLRMLPADMVKIEYEDTFDLYSDDD